MSDELSLQPPAKPEQKKRIFMGNAQKAAVFVLLAKPLCQCGDYYEYLNGASDKSIAVAVSTPEAIFNEGHIERIRVDMNMVLRPKGVTPSYSAELAAQAAQIKELQRQMASLCRLAEASGWIVT